MVAGLSEDTANYTKEVKLTQTQTGWQDTSIKDIGGVKIADIPSSGTVKVTYVAATDKTDATVTFAN